MMIISPQPSHRPSIRCDDVEISRDVSRINKEAVACNEARSISACPSRRPRSDTNGAGEFEVTVRDFNATHET